MRNHRLIITLGVATLALPTSTARADTFEAGSLIIPMDTDYQDMGMLEAFGLVYELLRNDIPVRWVIRTGKGVGETDFTASAVDHQTNAAVDQHGYRGGPWVIDSADAAAALAVVDTWQADHPDTAVHEATEAFDGDVSRLLEAAPTIAVFADGNEDIAIKYLKAAGIPDSTLDPDWPDESPDLLDPDEIMGPTDTDHADGALFTENGDAAYCQLMSMHWAIGDAADAPEVVAEVRSFLEQPTHFFAECQAVNAFENLDPHGEFVAEMGLEIGDQPDAVDILHPDHPFTQLDGEFGTVGGSEPSYTNPPDYGFKVAGSTFITSSDSNEGTDDVWIAAYLDGACPITDISCGEVGKVSYLGGHQYDIDLPISQNPTTQGTRLFLNSLFEAPCVTIEIPGGETGDSGDTGADDGAESGSAEGTGTGDTTADASGTDTAGDTSGGSDGAGSGDSNGCGCRSGPAGALGPSLLAFVIAGWRRRRPQRAT